MRVLRDYQKRVLRWTMTVQHPALYLDMRLGKTLIAVRAIKTYQRITKVLVVGPYSVLPGWERELTEEHERPMVLSGETDDRRLQLETLAGYSQRCWVLWNKEGWLHLPEVAGVRWDVVILDESTFIKNPQAGVSKYFNKYFRSVKHRWLLSGTPAPESDLDYVQQLRFLHVNNLLGMNFWRFRAKFAKPNHFNEWSLTDEGKAFIAQMLSRSAYFLTRGDVKLNGAKIHEQRFIELPADIRKAYDLAEQEFILEIDGEELGRTMAASQRYQWLRALCSGFADDKLASQHKFIELSDLLSHELSGKQAIIFCQRLMEIDYAVASLGLDGRHAEAIDGRRTPAEREALRKRFQSGELDTLVIQPETMKFGTSMTAADVIIYFSSPEGALTREQSEDRTVDVDVLDSILIIDLICTNTVEDDLVMALIRKEARSQVLERIAKGIQRRRSHEFTQ